LIGLDLFSGIGGISLALREYINPIAYCEIDKFARAVLLSRISSGDLVEAPIWDDIRTFKCPILRGAVDIIYGGFPCQDISVAGLGKGLEGERSGLFYEIVRLAKEILPTFIFLENVPAIRSRGGLRVVTAIAELGYDCRWCVISAAAVGALHRRERWFLLGYAKHHGSLAAQESGRSEAAVHPCSQGEDEASESTGTSPSGVLAWQAVANANGQECDGLPQRAQTTQPPARYDSESTAADIWRKAVSEIRRTSDGVPHRIYRIRALGNAVVPRQVKEAFEVLMGLK
jgi:DNA (cytosine-5)-methyltransferase 1